MKDKINIRLEAPHYIKKFFIEAKTAPIANDELSDTDALKILVKLSKQRCDATAFYKEKEQADLAAEENAQTDTIESYLSKQLTSEELEREVKTIISETGTNSIKDLGKIMRSASKKLASRAENKAISEGVKHLLSQQF